VEECKTLPLLPLFLPVLMHLGARANSTRLLQPLFRTRQVSFATS
jgi:hypothetical protein